MKILIFFYQGLHGSASLVLLVICWETLVLPLDIGADLKVVTGATALYQQIGETVNITFYEKFRNGRCDDNFGAQIGSYQMFSRQRRSCLHHGWSCGWRKWCCLWHALTIHGRLYRKTMYVQYIKLHKIFLIIVIYQSDNDNYVSQKLIVQSK